VPEDQGFSRVFVNIFLQKKELNPVFSCCGVRNKGFIMDKVHYSQGVTKNQS